MASRRFLIHSLTHLTAATPLSSSGLVYCVYRVDARKQQRNGTETRIPTILITIHGAARCDERTTERESSGREQGRRQCDGTKGVRPKAFLIISCQLMFYTERFEVDSSRKWGMEGGRRFRFHVRIVSIGILNVFQLYISSRLGTTGIGFDDILFF